jgi:hypothetical protein
METNVMAGHVSYMGGYQRCIKFWRGNMRGRNHLDDPEVDRKIILKWIIRKLDSGVHVLD